MIKKVTTLIMLILFFVGLSVLLYPAISSYWNSKTQSRVVESYASMVEELDQEAFDDMFRAAQDYNQALSDLDYPLTQFNQLTSQYFETLNLNGNGMMGYISIPSIGVEIPIYHTVSNTVLSHAAGHMEGTSLPVGGESTHSVISAHRGLPNAKLFTDLDKLQIGDYFTVSVMNRTITYQIDQIEVVVPENSSLIQIVDGKEYCSLITCTPYGINTHRLIVRGVRTDTVTAVRAYVSAEAYRIDTLIVTPIVALPILLVLIIIVMCQPVKQEKLIEGDDLL